MISCNFIISQELRRWPAATTGQEPQHLSLIQMPNPILHSSTGRSVTSFIAGKAKLEMKDMSGM
jgi:hypothetical protein